VTGYRSLSMWLDGVPGELAPRASLPGPIDLDVAVAGAGYTGLWTACYLKNADPTLRVAVLEKEIAGFGASGRNGGWCHTTFPGSRVRAAKTHGRQAVIDQQRALRATMPQIARVVAEERIDARFHIGGQLYLANSPVQLLRARETVEYERSWGFGEDD
jgi:glycine/D-amino acid oxidase-like deaminating enzyme